LNKTLFKRDLWAIVTPIPPYKVRVDVAAFYKLVRSPQLRLDDCEMWLEIAGPHVHWTLVAPPTRSRQHGCDATNASSSFRGDHDQKWAISYVSEHQGIVCFQPVLLARACGERHLHGVREQLNAPV
jgi:hypothetical protein